MEPPAVAPPSPKILDRPPGDSGAGGGAREKLVAMLRPREFETWFGAARFVECPGGGVRAELPGAVQVEHVRGQYVRQLQAAGITELGVLKREKVDG